MLECYDPLTTARPPSSPRGGLDPMYPIPSKATSDLAAPRDAMCDHLRTRTPESIHLAKHVIRPHVLHSLRSGLDLVTTYRSTYSPDTAAHPPVTLVPPSKPLRRSPGPFWGTRGRSSDTNPTKARHQGHTPALEALDTPLVALRPAIRKWRGARPVAFSDVCG